MTERTEPEPLPASARSAAAFPLVSRGETLAGRYTILEVLGQGGMGLVLAAYDSKLDRRVALKLLLPSLAEKGSDSLQTRLVREAQAMARLSHPHVVALYDTGTLEDGRLYLAMEYVPGQTLRQWLRDTPRSWREVLSAYVAAGRGLAAAHEAGLVHRDFKPDNVLVGKDGRVRVTDFGVARAEALSTGSPTPRPAVGTASAVQALQEGPQEVWETPLTLPGQVMGTPRYLAPELLGGQAADACSDLYAFCVALYESLYGQPAFEGKGLDERLGAQLAGKVNPPPARSEVPGWVTRALLKGLQVDAGQRPASMGALLAALEDDPGVKRQGRLGAAAVAGVVLALGAVAVRGFIQDPGPTCAQVAQERLAGVWDDSVRERVRQALLGTGLSYAQDTAERVEAALAQYAGEWVRLRTEACEAGPATPGKGQPLAVLQVYCLERRRNQLSAYAQLLAQGPDKELVPKAVQGVLSLPPLAYCTDTHALTAAVPPPEDPRLRARVEALQAQVDRLEALHSAAKYREGLELGERLLREAAAVDWGPLHARTRYILGRLRAGTGDYVGAEGLVRQALPLAARSRDDLLVARSWSALVLYVGYRQARHEEALFLRLPVESAVARAGEEVVRADSLHNLGLVLWEQGQYEQARASHEGALVILEKALGQEHPDVAHSLNNLGMVLRNQGHYEPARASLERALSIREKALGKEHPLVAYSLNNLAMVLRDQGQCGPARGYLERALVMQERGLGQEHPDVPYSLNNLGVVLRDQGQYELARAYLERAVAIREKTLGKGHPLVARSLSNLGLALHEQGQYAQARAYHERALAIREKALGPQHPDVAESYSGLGRTLVQLGELQAAGPHLEHALALREKTLGLQHLELSDALLGLGELALARGKPSEAVPRLERALSLAQGNRRAAAQLLLARALWESLVHRPRARELATQARDAYERLQHPPGLAQASRWLAEHSQP